MGLLRKPTLTFLLVLVLCHLSWGTSHNSFFKFQSHCPNESSWNSKLEKCRFWWSMLTFTGSIWPWLALGFIVYYSMSRAQTQTTIKICGLLSTKVFVLRWMSFSSYLLLFNHPKAGVDGAIITIWSMKS